MLETRGSCDSIRKTVLEGAKSAWGEQTNLRENWMARKELRGYLFNLGKGNV